VIQNPPAQFNSVFQAGVRRPRPRAWAICRLLGRFFFPPQPALVKQTCNGIRGELQPLATAEVARIALGSDYSGSHGVHLYSIENFNQRAWGNEYLGTDPVGE